MNLVDALALYGLTAGYSQEQVDEVFSRLVRECTDNGEHHKVADILAARVALISAIGDQPEPEPEPQEEKESDLAIKYLDSNSKNVFITGAGGTGKSFLLKALVQHWSNRNLAVVAFTGVAALNVSGETAHKFFKLPPHGALSFIDWKTKVNAKMRTKYEALDILILDEVSMASADLLDSINNLLKAARRSEEPFGGVRVVLFGDPWQLPPVIDQGDKVAYEKMVEKYPMGCWFFESEGYQAGDFEVIELVTNHRVQDADTSGSAFLKALSVLRKGEERLDALNLFNSRVGQHPLMPNAITIVSTNEEVAMINEDYMSKIQKPLMSFDIRVQILDNSLIGKEIDFDRLTPAKKLLLKEGAQVMFIKNDDQGNQVVNGKREVRWVNGTTGVIEGFSDDGETVFVRVKETVYPVGRSVWDDVQHEVVETVLPNGAIDAAIRPKTRIQYSQFPLKLAWALTIHKSQGQTYDAMYFDPSRIFAEGQTYVALSRSRSLEGIGLINPVTDNGVKVSEAVRQFMNTVKVKHLIEQDGSSSN